MISEQRNKFAKKAMEKDRDYFQDHESELRHCEKVWDIPMIYSSTTVVEGDSVVHELKCVSTVTKDDDQLSAEDRFKLAQQEYLKFSNFDEEGNYVGDDVTKVDAINTNRVFTKQATPTRHRFKPFDSSESESTQLSLR